MTRRCRDLSDELERCYTSLSLALNQSATHTPRRRAHRFVRTNHTRFLSTRTPPTWYKLGLAQTR